MLYREIYLALNDAREFTIVVRIAFSTPRMILINPRDTLKRRVTIIIIRETLDTLTNIRSRNRPVAFRV